MVVCSGESYPVRWLAFSPYMMHANPKKVQNPPFPGAEFLPWSP